MSKVVRSREHLHQAMSRDNWLLPSAKASITSLDFLEKVRTGLIYCPRVDTERSLRKCFAPPPRKVLHEKLEDAIQSKFEEDAIKADVLPQLQRIVLSVRARPADEAFYNL